MLQTITQKGILMMLILSFLLVVQGKTNAQKDSTELWSIITMDGNQFTGEIILQTEGEIQLKTNSLGIITLKLSDIKKMTQVNLKDLRADGIWMENPEIGRYFFSPSSYGLKKGEGYYQNTWIFFNQLSYGFTDNFSMGIGMIPLFLFNGAATPIWITPKFSIPIEEEKFAIGGGALIGTIIGEGSSYGVAYGTATVGSRDKNATLGVGYGYIGDEFANSPTLTFSAMIRTGKKGYLITENYYTSTSEGGVGTLSFGGRRVWSNVSLDFGGLLPLAGGNDDIILIPWLSIVISFGRK